MSTVELFTTRMVPHERRQDFWCSLVAETFPGMVADVPAGIRADLARWSIGKMAVAHARSDRARVERTRDVRDDRNLVFHFQRRGRLMMTQAGRVAIAGGGDIVIADEATPYTIDISDTNDCLIVHVPAPMLGAEAAARDWHAHMLDGHDPHVALFGRMLEGLWAERAKLDRLEEGVDGVLAGLARMACLTGSPREAEAPRDPVDYALSHLHDPELGTALIAEMTGLGARAVQKAFARHVAATPTGFIAEQRLQRAAEALRRRDGRSVTQIAFDVGFSDSAFFSRCFRRRFGQTPSAWRDRT